jgi:hypothetical protein
MRNDGTCRALALSTALSIASFAGCAHETAMDQPARPTRNAASNPTCDQAVANEAQILAITVRADAPGSDLAASLERFAEAPEITKDSLATLNKLRQLIHNICSDKDLPNLKKAASETAEACRAIDPHP